MSAVTARQQSAFLCRHFLRQRSAGGPFRVRTSLEDVNDAARPRLELLLARVAVAVRILQLVPWPLMLATSQETGLRHVWLGVGAYGTLAVWTLVWAGLTLERRQLQRGLVLVDTGVVGVCLVLAGLACTPQNTTSMANSAVSSAMGAALAAGLALRLPQAVLAWVWLLVAMLVSQAPGLAYEGGPPVVASNLAGALGCGIVGMLAAAYLRDRAGDNQDLVDKAQAGQLHAQQAIHDKDRLVQALEAQYATLHDSVLPTLTLVASGAVDPADPDFRRRATADASYLRGVLRAGPHASAILLYTELARLIRDLSGLGLRVEVSCTNIPEVPDEVITAVAAAAREALNNVRKHAGVDAARVVAREDEGRLLVVVSDSGEGFDPGAPGSGTGLRRSIGERMIAAGGSAALDSAPGEGTTVELRWPA